MIIKVNDDQRFHAAVEIAGEKFVGLLDSGAQISVVGSKFIELVERGRLRAKRSHCANRTADGTVHNTAQVVKLPITYCGTFREIEAPIMENLQHDLILGVDFWQKINIGRGKGTRGFKADAFREEGSIELLINNYAIDTGSAPPIKQTQYIISPYVQKEVHSEIDRLLAIGAI